jgi:hypothetical protein
MHTDSFRLLVRLRPFCHFVSKVVKKGRHLAVKEGEAVHSKMGKSKLVF